MNLLIASGLGIWGASALYALPPLGLTQIDSVSQPSRLSVIDETAYISTSAGVWLVDPLSSLNFIPILHSQFGQPINVATQVVKAFDSSLYVAANFSRPTSSLPVGALFRLDQSSSEIVTWPSAGRLVGIDRNLRTLGEDNAEFVAEYLIDGTVNPLGVPAECSFEECASSQSISDVTESGFATGTVKIRPNAPGSGIGVWDPAGNVTIAQSSEVPGRIADRLDGNGYNVSLGGNDGWYRLKLGETIIDVTQDEEGNAFPFYGFGSVWVAQSNFAVLWGESSSNTNLFAFYPGIVPGNDQAALSLFELFPELTSIDVDSISDMYAVSGRIYMTLYGADGTFLFGARDPSVVPEPATAVLMFFVASVALRRP